MCLIHHHTVTFAAKSILIFDILSLKFQYFLLILGIQIRLILLWLVTDETHFQIIVTVFIIVSKYNETNSNII